MSDQDRTSTPPGLSAARTVIRSAIRSGGHISGTRTCYDAERGGRVLNLTVFWPGDAGYALTQEPESSWVEGLSELLGDPGEPDMSDDPPDDIPTWENR